MIRYHCPECDLEVNKSECPICGNRTKVESKLYWCENCNVPIYEEICPECHAKGKYFTSDVRPVFPEERLLLEILLDKPLAFIEDSVWNGVGNRYYVNGKKITFSIAEAIKKDPKVVREKLAQYEAQNKNLYDILLAKPYGMRKGIIPLFIAYILRLYKENIVLYYSGKEVELSASILSNLNENPAKYELLMEMGTLDREVYLDRLETMFATYADNKAGSANRVYAVMRSMQNWYRSLPEYSKKYTFFLEAGEKKAIAEFIPPLRSDLAKYDVNARDLLFVQWSKRLSESGDMEECANKIEIFRDTLMKHIPDYRTEMCRVLVAMFVPGYQGQLPKHPELPCIKHSRQE